MQPVSLPRPLLTRVPRTAIRRSAFTLIEMVVVMGIVAAIIAVGWRLFKAPTGAAVDSAARTVGTEFRLARQYALANNVYVAVLMPSKNDLSGVSGIGPVVFSSTEQANLSNGAVRACVVTRKGTTFTWERDVDGAEWKFLPSGVEIEDGVFTGAMQCDSAVIRSGTTPFNCRAIIYKPNGQLAQSSSSPTFAIRPSSANLGTASEEKNGVQITVNWVTGKIAYGEVP